MINFNYNLPSIMFKPSDILKKSPVFLIFDHVIGGGSNFYREALIEKITLLRQVFLLVSYDISSKKYYLTIKNQAPAIDFEFSNFKLLEEAIQKLNVVELFYNHVILYEDPLIIADYLIRAKKYFGAKLTIAIHDFYTICPSYALISYQDQFCGVPKSINECIKCFSKNKHVFSEDRQINVKAWREKWWQCLLHATKIKFFSYSSVEVLKRAYPNLDCKKIHVEPHRMDHIKKFFIDDGRVIDTCLHIGVVGIIDNCLHKGKKIILEMLDIIKNNNLNIKLTVIGLLETSENYPFLTVTGKYKREHLPELINNSKINVFFMSSICSETFSYVTHELIHFGVPLASFDIGAQAEAISSYKNGCLIPEIDSMTAIQTLQQFHAKLNSRNFFK